MTAKSSNKTTSKEALKEGEVAGDTHVNELKTNTATDSLSLPVSKVKPDVYLWGVGDCGGLQGPLWLLEVKAVGTFYAFT